MRRGGLSGRELGREGDRQAHELLVAALRVHRPEDAVRSEEGGAVSGGDGRLWIVDPLDGTVEYCERGRGDWAVHVALAVGGRVVAGAVALSSGKTWWTGAPEPLAAVPERRPLVAVSRSHRPALVDGLAEVADVELVPMGSAGVKASGDLSAGVAGPVAGGVGGAAGARRFGVMPGFHAEGRRKPDDPAGTCSRFAGGTSPGHRPGEVPPLTRSGTPRSPGPPKPGSTRRSDRPSRATTGRAPR
ncbi:inositol monophosphatase family protein [Saccharothrix syringae]|uniref:inositol monophosphatase family protein n=1 Tax=Saccharothrix syringae TaxID=103733 RepID=UPI0020104835